MRTTLALGRSLEWVLGIGTGLPGVAVTGGRGTFSALLALADQDPREGRAVAGVDLPDEQPY